MAPLCHDTFGRHGRFGDKAKRETESAGREAERFGDKAEREAKGTGREAKGQAKRRGFL